MADSTLLQLPSEVLLKVFKDIQGGIPDELQPTLHGLALTARKLVPIASEVLLEQPIVHLSKPASFAKNLLLDTDLAAKIKSIEIQSFRSDQHLVARLVVDLIPHFSLSRADKQQWLVDLNANHINALFGVSPTILPKDTELRLSACELHHLSFLSVFQSAHVGADIVTTWQRPRSWGRTYLDAAVKAHSRYVHTLHLPVGWCRDFLLENDIAVPKLWSLMCLSSLHHLIISDAAIESPSIFRMMLPVTIKSIVIVDAHGIGMLTFSGDQSHRARALGVKVKIRHPTQVTFTSKDAYGKTFVVSDDELAQFKEFKRDISGYI